MWMPLTRAICPAAPLVASQCHPLIEITSVHKPLTWFSSSHHAWSPISQVEPPNDRTQSEAVLHPQGLSPPHDPKPSPSPAGNFLLGFPTGARHPYSLIVIVAITFTYQPRNGNWDYYSRQGLNCGVKFHGKHNTARWPLGK